MSKFRIPMNLQLFAGVNDDGVDPEDLEEDPAPGGDEDDDLEEDDDGVDYSDDEEEGAEDDESEDDESDDDASDPADKPPKDGKKPQENQTGNAVIAERRKWQQRMKDLEARAAIGDRVMKQSGAASVEEMNQRIDLLETERLKKAGMDPQTAAAFVAQQRQIADMQASLRKSKYDGEVERLKKDAFFADIDDHRDELEELADSTGLSIEQAYRAVHGERRLKEREAEIEARVKANRAKRDGKRVNTAPSATSGKKPGKSLNLTPEQIAAADYGIKKGVFKSREEYARLLR